MAINDFGKIPPQAVDLEKAILGAILLEKDAFLKVKGILNEDSFYVNAHVIIFKAIKSISNNNTPIDSLTLLNELSRVNGIDTIGGPLYVSKLTDNIANAAHIEHHARIIAQKHVQRELIRVSSMVQTQAFNDEDPDLSVNLLNTLLEDINKITNQGGRGSMLCDIVDNSTNAYQDRVALRKEGKISGIPSLSAHITEHTQGWQADKVMVVAGRPGSGKTAYALAEAKAASKAGFTPCFFSLEMGELSLVDRLLIAEAEGLDSDEMHGYAERYRKGKLTDDEVEKLFIAKQNLSKVNMYINDKPSCTLDYIHTTCKALQRKGNCDMIIIDYLQLLSSVDNSTIREQEVARMSRKLKLIAKDLSLPIFILAQLNRAVEQRATKQPILADLRESGAIEQDADMVIFPFRPKYYIDQMPDFENLMNDGYSEKYPDVDWNKTAMIIFAKDRENGTTKVLLDVNNSCTKWKDHYTLVEDNIQLNNVDYYDPKEGFENPSF